APQCGIMVPTCGWPSHPSCPPRARSRVRHAVHRRIHLEGDLMAVVTATAKPDSVAWVEAEKGYQLGLRDGKLVCQNPSGKPLASVPKWLRDSEQGEALLALAEWLQDHATECLHTV